MSLCVLIIDEEAEEEAAESEKAETEQEVKSQMSENEFMEALTEQAREIAKAVLQGDDEAGTDLASDAKVCAYSLHRCSSTCMPNLMFLSRTGSFLLFKWLIFILDPFHSLSCREFHSCVIV